MTEQVWWFATRGAGLLTWAMASMSIILGLLMSTNLMGRNPGFPWLLDLHRFLSGLTLSFLGLHLVTLWADSFVTFGPLELFVPLTSEWRAGAVAWGILSMYLLVAVEISSRIKDRIPHRWWHGIHISSFGVVVFGSIHAWQAGSDVSNPFVLAFALACLALIVGLTGLRLAITRGAVPSAAPATDRATMLAAARNEAQTRAGPRPSSLATKWTEAADRH